LADLDFETLKTTAFLDENPHATKITVDVRLNGEHWTNEKASIDLQ
jgi:hypothetical protein